MKVRIVAVAAVALLSWAGTASAQVTLEFNNGRVNLKAQNAPLRTILAEWARLGGTRIVNGERVTGGPVTLEFTGVAERQVMDVLLRSAAGYIIGARQPGTAGASTFGSIMILPTSAAGRQATPAQQPQRAARNVPEPEPEPDDSGGDPPAFDDERPENSARQAAEEAARRRIAERRQQIFVGDQVVETPADGRPGQPPAAGNPFSLPAGGSARPGIITTPPPQGPGGRRQPDAEP